MQQIKPNKQQNLQPTPQTNNTTRSLFGDQLQTSIPQFSQKEIIATTINMLNDINQRISKCLKCIDDAKKAYETSKNEYYKGINDRVPQATIDELKKATTNIYNKALEVAKFKMFDLIKDDNFEALGAKYAYELRSQALERLDESKKLFLKFNNELINLKKEIDTLKWVKSEALKNPIPGMWNQETTLQDTESQAEFKSKLVAKSQLEMETCKSKVLEIYAQTLRFSMLAIHNIIDTVYNTNFEPPSVPEKDTLMLKIRGYIIIHNELLGFIKYTISKYETPEYIKRNKILFEPVNFEEISSSVLAHAKATFNILSVLLDKDIAHINRKLKSCKIEDEFKIIGKLASNQTPGTSDPADLEKSFHASLTIIENLAKIGNEQPLSQASRQTVSKRNQI